MNSNRGDEDTTSDDSTPARMRARHTPARMRGSIPLGVGLVAIGHVVACLGAIGLGHLFGDDMAGLMWFLFLGVTQLVHVVPLAIWMQFKGHGRTVKGIWIGAGITALLAAACFGIALSGSH